MFEIQDKILIFLCCFALYMLDTQSEYAIVPILLAVFLSCLGTYLDDRRLKLAFFLIYIACCQLIPGCFIFLPFIIYDIALYDYQFLSILSLLPLFSNFHNYHLTIVVLCFVFFILSFTLKYKTLTSVRLQTEYNELRDTSKELSLLQEQKNQSLLENQDYEINVATLNERNRISKEIHDNIGHMLSRSLLQVGALLTIEKEKTSKEALTALKESLSDGMTSIRNSIHDLHDESIDLFTSIDGLVNEFTFCNINFEYDMKSNPDIKLTYSFIAITKEALANIIKHSNATKVTICLREHPALYQLIIMDNGTMEEQKKQKLSKLIENQLYYDGIGIQNITDRVKTFGGNINISLDKGFQIFITIPKNNL
jgi:signal transduction histidine kinase